MSQYVKKQKSSPNEENLIVDLSAIPPQSETKPPEDPLAGLMPLPPDTTAKDSKTRFLFTSSERCVQREVREEGLASAMVDNQHILLRRQTRQAPKRNR